MQNSAAVSGAVARNADVTMPATCQRGAFRWFRGTNGLLNDFSRLLMGIEASVCTLGRTGVVPMVGTTCRLI
jgi:hypothetical protein